MTDDLRGAKPPISQMAPSTTVRGVYAAKFLEELMELLSLRETSLKKMIFRSVEQCKTGKFG